MNHVKCTKTGKIYRSIKEASEDLGISYGYLRMQLHSNDYKNPHIVYSDPDPISLLTREELEDRLRALQG